MLDPFAEDFRPLADLLGELPIRPSPAVVCRWHLRGANGTRLEVLKICGRLFTQRSELRRFLQGQQTPNSTADREGRIDADLHAAGLLNRNAPRFHSSAPTVQAGPGGERDTSPEKATNAGPQLKQPNGPPMAGPVLKKDFVEDLERLAQDVRNTFIGEVRHRHEKEFGLPSSYLPAVRWEGGIDAAGRRHAAIWPLIAIFVIKNDLEPVAFIRAQFNPTRHIPTPGSLLTREALERYRLRVKEGGNQKRWAVQFPRPENIRQE